MAEPASGRLGRRRLAVVSLHAHRPLAPRGERTRRLLERLERDWEVELIAPPPSLSTGGATGSGRSNSARRLARRIVSLVLLDKWEPWSAKRLLRWQPRVDAALLIGHPYSPLVYASRRLREAAVPYVVDVGDPWVLTSLETELSALARARAAGAERRLWHGAAGAVLTTPQQAGEIERVAPGIRTLVRPGGYDEVGAVAEPSPDRTDSVLRLAHFGMFNNQRLDPRPLLGRLALSGRWSSIVLAQFGDDFAGFLDEPIPGVEVERHPTYPWPEVLERAPAYDLAVVLGNRNPSQLPSKAVQYLTLPIPRLAISAGGEDALAAYVAGKPGWLTLGPEQEDAAERVQDHLSKRWAPAEMAPPAAESWPGVAETIAEFLAECVTAGGSR
ncbi:MAG: hypothetical protein ACJ76D_03710 [Solirubrobacterales bacterium]